MSAASRKSGLMRYLRRLHQLFGSDPAAISGVASVELAIIAPILAVALVCTVDLGLGIYRNMQVEAAAQAGTQYVITHGFSANAITTAVAGATPLTTISATPAPAQFCGCATSGGIASSTCGAPCPGGSNPGTYVTVSARASYTPLLPYPMFPATFVLSSQSTVRTQ